MDAQSLDVARVSLHPAWPTFLASFDAPRPTAVRRVVQRRSPQSACEPRHDLRPDEPARPDVVGSRRDRRGGQSDGRVGVGFRDGRECVGPLESVVGRREEPERDEADEDGQRSTGESRSESRHDGPWPGVRRGRLGAFVGKSTRVRSPCPSVFSSQTGSLSLVMLAQNPLLRYPEVLGKDALAQRAWHVHSTGSDERRLQDAVQPPQLPGESSSSPCFALRNPTSDPVSSCFNSCLTALGSGRASGWLTCVGTEKRTRRAVSCLYSALSFDNSTDSHLRLSQGNTTRGSRGGAGMPSSLGTATKVGSEDESGA